MVRFHWQFHKHGLPESVDVLPNVSYSVRILQFQHIGLRSKTVRVEFGKRESIRTGD